MRLRICSGLAILAALSIVGTASIAEARVGHIRRPEQASPHHLRPFIEVHRFLGAHRFFGERERKDHERAIADFPWDYPFGWGGDTWTSPTAAYPVAPAPPPAAAAAAVPGDDRATVETTPEGVTIVRGPGSRHIAR